MAKSDIEPETAEKTAHFGFTTIDRDEKQERVDEVFSRVAKRYDLMNDLMSGGLHRLWKDAVIDWMAPPAKGAFQLLDVAGGTGDIAFRFAARTETSATATVLDINPGMLAVGEKRAAQKGLEERVSFVDGIIFQVSLGSGERLWRTLRPLSAEDEQALQIELLAIHHPPLYMP